MSKSKPNVPLMSPLLAAELYRKACAEQALYWHSLDALYKHAGTLEFEDAVHLIDYHRAYLSDEYDWENPPVNFALLDALLSQVPSTVDFCVYLRTYVNAMYAGRHNLVKEFREAVPEQFEHFTTCWWMHVYGLGDDKPFFSPIRELYTRAKHGGGAYIPLSPVNPLATSKDITSDRWCLRRYAGMLKKPTHEDVWGVYRPLWVYCWMQHVKEDTGVMPPFDYFVPEPDLEEPSADDTPENASDHVCQTCRDGECNGYNCRGGAKS